MGRGAGRGFRRRCEDGSLALWLLEDAEDACCFEGMHDG
jgi:hypothetical protein